MSTLEKVLEGVEAFKKDMKELGVDVKLSIVGISRAAMKGPSITLIGVVVPELEDPEAEG